MARIDFDSWDFDYLANDVTDISNKIDDLRIFVASQFSEEKENDLFVDGFNNSYKYLEDERNRLNGNIKLINEFKDATNSIEETYIKEFNDVEVPVVAYRDVTMRFTAEPVQSEETPQPVSQPEPQPAPAPASVQPVAAASTPSGTSSSTSTTSSNTQTTTTTDTTNQTGTTGTTSSQNATTAAEAVPTDNNKINGEKKDDGTLQTIATIAGAAAAVGLVGVGAAAVAKKHKDDDDEDEAESSYYGRE